MHVDNCLSTAANTWCCVSSVYEQSIVDTYYSLLLCLLYNSIDYLLFVLLRSPPPIFCIASITHFQNAGILKTLAK